MKNMFTELYNLIKNPIVRTISAIGLVGMIAGTSGCSPVTKYENVKWLPASAKTLNWNGFVGEGGGTDDDWYYYNLMVKEKNKGKPRYRASDTILLPDLDGNGCVGDSDCLKIKAPVKK